MRKQHVTHGVSRGKRHTLHCSATATHVALQCNGNTRCIAVQRQHTLHCSATATHVVSSIKRNETHALCTSGCRQRAPQGAVNAHLRVVSTRTSGWCQCAPQGAVNAHLRVVSTRTSGWCQCAHGSCWRKQNSENKLMNTKKNRKQ
jgi:hypothetical protein